jgi:hypothetical protein
MGQPSHYVGRRTAWEVVVMESPVEAAVTNGGGRT